MGTIKSIGGQKELKEKVLDAGLCTHCGACVNLCPYAACHKDNTIILDACNREEGRCYAFCPRTPTDWEALQQSLFDPADLTPELGPFKGFYITRATDPEVRNSAQHGGTVTALVSLALREGIIDAAVLAEEGENLLPQGVMIRKDSNVARRGKSKFVVSPTVGTFNLAAKGSFEKIGVVATPCQTLALAKMRRKPIPSRDQNIDKLKLIIGLFCGWALSWRELKTLLQKKIGGDSILALDIPPSKYHSLEVHTPKGVREISLDEVLPSVRPACNYCLDMTAEFSDLSVGSARLPEGWEVAKGWNQVIVRTKAGEELMDLARKRGILEFRDVPPGNLAKLKEASLNKKRGGLKNLIAKSGSADDWIYLNRQDPILGKLLG